MHWKRAFLQSGTNKKRSVNNYFKIMRGKTYPATRKLGGGQEKKKEGTGIVSPIPEKKRKK